MFLLEQKDNIKILKNTINRILYQYSETLNTQITRADLSKIRRAKNIEDVLTAIPHIFELIPEELMGYGDNLSFYEISILQTLRIFSIYQEANYISTIYKGNLDKENDNDFNNYKFYNLGTALRCLRSSASDSMDKRVNNLLSSRSGEQFYSRLTSLMKILKSNNDSIKINYGDLAVNFFMILIGKRENVVISIGREYYKTPEKRKEL